MKKLTIKNLVTYRNKSARARATFLLNLKKEKKKSNEEGGGDYWISCLSSIRNYFKHETPELLDNKIDYLFEKIKVTELKRIKDQHQRNIDIINNYKDFDHHSLKPNGEITILKQSRSNFILDIEGLPIEANPCHIYSFSKNGSDELGGVWFLAKLKGFKRSELGMFSEVMYRYLIKNYSKKFFVNPEYCISVDLFNGHMVRFSDLKNEKVPSIFDSTISDIKIAIRK